MSFTPFLSEIEINSFNFAPKGWAQCNGQLLPINQNQALFSLLGTTYGGDGRVNFGLPDLRGRIPMHMGNGYTLGQRAGEENHTLNMSEMPQHVHLVNASATQSDSAFIQTASPASQNVFGTVAGGIYGSATQLTTLAADSVTTIGGNQAHTNQQPLLVLNFCIALQGIFPSQN
jgi:microcystin-dependent protein